jgi:hypothetical protein
MTLERWQFEVSNHLQMIEAGAEMCERHTKALPIRPGFRTLAEDEMERCEVTLLRALMRLRKARAIYRRKEIDA